MFYVQCEASDTGIGAILFQVAEDKSEPIAKISFSQKPNPTQRNYSMTTKKCLATVLAGERFRPYIEVMPCKLLMDHSSLKWNMSVKYLTGRFAM